MRLVRNWVLGRQRYEVRFLSSPKQSNTRPRVVLIVSCRASSISWRHRVWLPAHLPLDVRRRTLPNSLSSAAGGHADTKLAIHIQRSFSAYSLLRRSARCSYTHLTGGWRSRLAPRSPTADSALLLALIPPCSIACVSILSSIIGISH